MHRTVAVAPETIDHDLRNILEELIEGMFPLAAWIEDKVAKGGYKPHEHVPWRDKGRSLSTRDMGAVEFFEELLGQSPADAPLADRFVQVLADPLSFSPYGKKTSDWRRSRKLDLVATFGIVASQNVIATTDGEPVTRAQFYAPFWSLLRRAVNSANLRAPADWEVFAEELLSDASVYWPAGQPLKSSSFMKQFGRDILHALLNLRNPAADPFRVAFLEELGEHRRVGNSFTRDDVERFVQAFKERITAL